MLRHIEAQALLRKYEISMPASKVFGKLKELKKPRFPAVLKVDSPEVIHKSDLGLVFVNIKSYNELEQKFRLAQRMLKSRKIREYSYLFQPMISGQELIIGMKRDQVFGPVILLGAGGILVELMKDVIMRIAPLTRRDCFEMLESIKARKLLEGYRGSKSVDKELVVDLLLKLSRLSMAEKNVQEIDFNPVIVNKKAYVVDARVIADA